LDLEISKLNLSRQKKKLETVTAQYQAGLVPESVLEQLELAVYQLEYMVNINTLIIMNTQDKFNRSLTEGSNTGYFMGGE
jgi:outer membrane protein TolC